MTALARISPSRDGDPPELREVVHLLDVEPELAEGLSRDDLALARRYLAMPAVRVPAGPWTPHRALSRGLSLLVVEGLVVREGTDRALPDVELLGAVDFVDVRVVPASSSVWRVLSPALVARLDARLLAAVRRWPQLLLGLTRRLFDRQRESARLGAIRALPRVDERILAYLWHAAHRWGHVTLEGIAVSLPVTHELLGRLVGARRPTVSLALAGLTAEGRVARLRDGRWLLPTEPGAGAVAESPGSAPWAAVLTDGRATAHAPSTVSLVGADSHDPGTSA